MSVLKLPAHNRSVVEIDVCEPCTLIWFDGFESSKLAGPGLVGLVTFIHATLKRNDALQALPPRLTCQVCAAPLKRVFNMSRFGRTAQLECPDKHGAYQSFQLFLAEKGYYRPYTWQDIKQLDAAGKRIQCVQCGATLESRPQDACPYCASPVGLIDPARLASAIDIHQDAGPLRVAAKANQSACPACGGIVDLTQDISCRHCQAVLPAPQTAAALAVSEVVADAVWREHINPTPQLVREKRAGVRLKEFSDDDTAASLVSSTRLQFRMMGGLLVLLLLGFLAIKFVLPWLGWDDDKPYEMAAADYDVMVNAKLREHPELGPADHARDGESPPQVAPMRLRRDILLVRNHSGSAISVRVNLALPRGRNTWRRCRMRAVAANSVMEEEAVIAASDLTPREFLARECKAGVLQEGKLEFVIKDAKTQRVLFMSDSALFD